MIGLKNWRFTPRSEIVNDIAIEGEIHLIAHDGAANAIGIRLNEGCRLTGSFPFNTHDDYLMSFIGTGDVRLREVPRSTPPSSGQFRVDYDAETYYATSFVEFNAADVGKSVVVNYRSTGTTTNINNQANEIIDRVNENVMSYFNKRISFRYWNGYGIGDIVNTPDIATDGNIYVIIGGRTSPDAVRNYYSYDLVTWTQGTNSFTSTSTIFNLKYANGLFVAVGDNGELETSVDGITFTARTSTFSSSRIRAVHYDPVSMLWVAVGAGGKIASSPTGVTWTAGTSGFDSTEIGGVASDGLGHWLITGPSKYSTSNDGLSWSFSAGGSAEVGQNYYCVYANGIFLIIGGGRTYWTSNRSTFNIVTGSIAASGLLIYRIDYDPVNSAWVGVVNSTDVPLVYSLDNMVSRFGIGEDAKALLNGIMYEPDKSRWLAIGTNNNQTAVWVSRSQSLAEV